VSTDGAQGVLCSNKLKGVGGWDLYSFDLYDKAKPRKVLFLTGTIKSETDNEPVRGSYRAEEHGNKEDFRDPTGYDDRQICRGGAFLQRYIMTVKKKGYVDETRYISKVDTAYKKPVKLDLEIMPIELQHSYKINDIFFRFNSYELTVESNAVLDQLIQFLIENPTVYIEIQDIRII